MLSHDQLAVPDSSLEEAQRDDLTPEDALTSALIDCYEKAVGRGLSPLRAIAAILGWTADETARIRADAQKQAEK